MENNTPSVDVKYHKLASEYSKVSVRLFLLGESIP